MPNGQNVTIWRDTRCCLAKTGAKTPKLGTVGKKGRFWLFLYNPHLVIPKGANRYQKEVGQNGVGKGISGFTRQLFPRTYFRKVIFALNRGFLL